MTEDDVILDNLAKIAKKAWVASKPLATGNPKARSEVQWAAVAKAVREAVLEEARAEIERRGKTLGGVNTDRMGGDNLAIVLCGRFDNPDQEDDDNGWSQDATEGCDEVLAAIRKHFAL